MMAYGVSKPYKLTASGCIERRDSCSIFDNAGSLEFRSGFNLVRSSAEIIDTLRLSCNINEWLRTIASEKNLLARNFTGY